MILLIDQGNSRLKWACVDDDGCILGNGAGAVGGSPEAALSEVHDYLGSPLDAAYASVVAGSARTQMLERAVGSLFGVSLHFASTGTNFRGLRNGYLEPKTLGVDRWLGMVGGWTTREGASVIVDAGTAMTVDAIAEDGRHLGGYIVPGYQLQCSSLRKNADGIRHVSVGDESGTGAEWGRSTDAAVANGVRFGLAALINGAQVELQGRVADTCPVVVTGGDAHMLAGALGHRVLVDEDLLFRGLWATISPVGVGLYRRPILG